MAYIIKHSENLPNVVLWNTKMVGGNYYPGLPADGGKSMLISAMAQAPKKAFAPKLGTSVPLAPVTGGAVSAAGTAVNAPMPAGISAA